MLEYVSNFFTSARNGKRKRSIENSTLPITTALLPIRTSGSMMIMITISVTLLKKKSFQKANSGEETSPTPSYQGLNLWPFNHESGTLPTELSPPLFTYLKYGGYRIAAHVVIKPLVECHFHVLPDELLEAVLLARGHQRWVQALRGWTVGVVASTWRLVALSSWWIWNQWTVSRQTSNSEPLDANTRFH